MTELIDLADSAHERAATQEAEEELGGVRKSASDEVMGTRQKETSIGGGGCSGDIPLAPLDWMVL